jgi:hypothetical protein
MLQVPQTRIVSEDVTSSVATEEYSKTELIAARGGEAAVLEYFQDKMPYGRCRMSHGPYQRAFTG